MKQEPASASRQRTKLFIGAACLLAAAVVANWLWPRDAQYYFNRAEERLQPAYEDGTGDDSAGALADFTRAIQLDPHFAAAYRARGQIEEGERALSDFNKAIELEPTNKLNYVTRSWFWESSGHRDQALADLNRAIEINPMDEELFTRRAQLKSKMGDFTGMVADMAHAGEVFPPSTNLLRMKTSGLSPDATNPERLLKGLLRMYDRALDQNTTFLWGYLNRGVIEDLANDPQDALADFRRCQTFADPKLRDDAALHIWLTQAKRNDKDVADRELSNYFGDRLKSAGWEAQIAKFLLGQMSEKALFAAAGAPDIERKRSEAWYYAGIKQLLAGNKDQAADDLQKSRMTETRPYAVAIASQIELTQLDK